MTLSARLSAILRSSRPDPAIDERRARERLYPRGRTRGVTKAVRGLRNVVDSTNPLYSRSPR